MDSILQQLRDLPAETWQAIGAFIIASPIIVILLQNIKRWAHLKSEKVITLVLTLLSGVAAGIDWLINNVDANIVPVRFGGYVGFAVLLYKFIGKPIINKIRETVTSVRELSALNKERKATQAASEEFVPS